MDRLRQAAASSQHDRRQAAGGRQAICLACACYPDGVARDKGMDQGKDKDRMMAPIRGRIRAALHFLQSKGKVKDPVKGKGRGKGKGEGEGMGLVEGKGKVRFLLRARAALTLNPSWQGQICGRYR